MQQNCDLATEKLAFECDKSVSAATANPRQHNQCLTNGTIFLTIPYCTIYCIKYSLDSILFILMLFVTVLNIS